MLTSVQVARVVHLPVLVLPDVGGNTSSGTSRAAGSARLCGSLYYLEYDSCDYLEKHSLATYASERDVWDLECLVHMNTAELERLFSEYSMACAVLSVCSVSGDLFRGTCVGAMSLVWFAQ